MFSPESLCKSWIIQKIWNLFLELKLVLYEQGHSPGFSPCAAAASTSSGCSWRIVPRSSPESALTQSSQTVACQTNTEWGQDSQISTHLELWMVHSLTLWRSLPRASTKSHSCSSSIRTTESSWASLKLSLRVRPAWKATRALFSRSTHSRGYVLKHGSPSRVLKQQQPQL